MEGKALLVNICLHWQSQAFRLPRLPASLLALCAHSSQPSARRDTPGEAGRLAAKLSCTGWRPALHPHLGDSGPGRRAAQGPSICLPQAETETTHCEISLDSELAAFPRGHPRFLSFLFWKKAKARDKTLGACLQITPPSTLQRSLPAPTAAHGRGSHLAPWATEARRVPSLGKPSPQQWVAVPGTHQLSTCPGVTIPRESCVHSPIQPPIHSSSITYPPVQGTVGWTHK